MTETHSDSVLPSFFTTQAFLSKTSRPGKIIILKTNLNVSRAIKSTLFIQLIKTSQQIYEEITKLFSFHRGDWGMEWWSILTKIIEVLKERHSQVHMQSYYKVLLFHTDTMHPLNIKTFCESAFPNSRETCNEYLIQCH